MYIKLVAFKLLLLLAVYNFSAEAMESVNFPSETAYIKANQLAEKIVEKSKQLKLILSDYQPQNVTDYEIERAIRTLRGLHNNGKYFTEEKIDSAAILLPSNLPLYSFILFGIIPSFLSKEINVRPNTLLQVNDIISRIYNELELASLFPNISIINGNHEEFKEYLKRASLVVFTGKPSNGEKVLLDMKKDSLLVINGSGHNPVVVTNTANLDDAVKGTLMLKGFNGGQDCAGPDAILVQEGIAEKFIAEFKAKFSLLKVGSFSDADTIIGPIKRFSELQRFAEIFNKNNKDIVSGGIIDFRDEIVHPTTIVRGIKRYPNYKEMFGPVAIIHPYKNDDDLSYYFEDIGGRYNANRMYVTVYGDSDYLSDKDDSL